MRKIITIWLCCILIIACNDKKPPPYKEDITSKLVGFEFSGTLKSYLSDKVYLNRIIDNGIYPIDSSVIKNNQFIFKGFVNYPERFVLTFQNYSATVILIVENTEFNINLNPNELSDPLITGSPLNSKLNEYKLASKIIFNKIDLLYPQFQKARLENDAEKLIEIGSEMKNIETEFTNFSYDFIRINKNSFVAAMILRDQLKASEIDSLRILNSYKILSEEVKNSPDAKIIASVFNLH
jgi:hypothetical protein